MIRSVQKFASLSNTKKHVVAVLSFDQIKIASFQSCILSQPNHNHIASMAKDQAPYLSLRCSCYALLFLSSFSSSLFVYWSYFSIGCHTDVQIAVEENKGELNLVAFPAAWNSLQFPSEAPPRLLKLAVFVKKWPDKHHAGGLERHAMTLHRALAKRGHELHVFTSSSSTNATSMKNLYFHLSKPTAAGYLDQATIWKQFQMEDSGGRPFDVVHTESVGLMHTRARNVTNLAVSWHGISYESMHSDIIQELLRAPEESQSSILRERLIKVVEEIRFFPRYAHHVATSDHVGDVLKRIYMLPEERVHIILNGVDEEIFKPEEASRGEDFKLGFGIQDSAPLILGIAGRLVKDKGHPLIFEALKQIFNESSKFKENVIVLVAGDGPWGARYKELGSNLRVLGPLGQAQLARFYNVIDIFVNPTLRAQGLDHTLLEAMLVGKPLMATKLASITGSVVVSQEIGYTFSPTVDALKKALYDVWKDGRIILQHKGQLARKRALKLFTATKMAMAYERLFLCIAENTKGSNGYCTYRNN
ncbi:UDP-Glycosyltransferase superfamily protein [Perilla frutescens var. hirtella]|nr:UDP-Glycosyltransferase superfamily protein [Perilla frutescens var. hirtella]KAH6810484.1 UDP-Glycosyltransferase superfamily protein [Perilla frutescens var. frutescens]